MTPLPLRTAPAAALGVAMLAGLAGIAAPTPGRAQDFYIGQIIPGGWNFCPNFSLPAHGQILSISQNTALFSLLGTRFGGNGITTFALPDLRGRLAVGAGTGPGLPGVDLGGLGGQASVALTTAQIPAHRHGVSTTATGSLRVASGAPTGATAASGSLSNTATGIYANVVEPGVGMPAGQVEVQIAASTNPTGSGQTFDNRGPYLGLTYCIILQGIFPPRP
jgi:microcystin-dependent protein